MARRSHSLMPEVLHLMNTTKIKNTIKGFSVASAMAFGIIMFSGASADAQNRRADRGRDDDRYEQQQQNGVYNNGRDHDPNGQYDDRRRGNGHQMREAMQRGYQDGLRQGIQAAQNRRGGYGNNDGYGNGGYYGNNGSYGGGSDRDSARIQRAYRNGFDRGYREGLRRGQNNRRGSGIRWPF